VLISFCLTMVVGAAGNSASQSAGTLLVGLARGEIDATADFGRILAKELIVGVALGLLLAFVAFLRVLVIGQGSETASVFMSSFTIALALLLTVVVASVLGAAIPLVLKRMSYRLVGNSVNSRCQARRQDLTNPPSVYCVHAANQMCVGLRIDPALGSGPALSTLTDVCGVLLLCLTATLLLRGG
jgi:Mg/Co/Ni transporter MgtE